MPKHAWFWHSDSLTIGNARLCRALQFHRTELVQDSACLLHSGSLRLHSPRNLRRFCNFEGIALNTNPTPTNPAKGQLLRLPSVEAVTGLKKTTIYTHMANKADPFPAPVRIGARAVAWREADVLAWIATRPAFVLKGGNK